MISAALIGRVLRAADAQQRRNKRCANVASVATQVGISNDLATRTFMAAEDRGFVKPLVRSRLRTSTVDWVVLRPGRAALAANYGERQPKPFKDQDLRARAWRAIRLQRKFTAGTLMSIIFEAQVDTYTGAYKIVCGYLLALESALVITCIHRNRDGKRFALLEDLGPQAPVPQPSKARLYDPNANRFIERPTAAQLLAGARR